MSFNGSLPCGTAVKNIAPPQDLTSAPAHRRITWLDSLKGFAFQMAYVRPGGDPRWDKARWHVPWP